MADVAQRPRTKSWSFRGDFGLGVQLYQLGPGGQVHPLLVNRETAPWGAGFSALEPPYNVGIFAYGWSPDGRAVWYSRPSRHSSSRMSGVLYNSSYMLSGYISISQEHQGDTGVIRGRELHVYLPAAHTDRRVISIGPYYALQQLNGPNTVIWDKNSGRLSFQTIEPTVDGGQKIFWRNIEIGVLATSSKMDIESGIGVIPAKLLNGATIVTDGRSKYLRVSLGEDEQPTRTEA